jgi:hypothetical protein
MYAYSDVHACCHIARYPQAGFDILRLGLIALTVVIKIKYFISEIKNTFAADIYSTQYCAQMVYESAMHVIIILGTITYFIQ